MINKYSFTAITNQNGAYASGGTAFCNEIFPIKGFYYQPRNKKQNWIIIITDAGRLKFAEEDIEIAVTVS